MRCQNDKKLRIFTFLQPYTICEQHIYQILYHIKPYTEDFCGNILHSVGVSSAKMDNTFLLLYKRRQCQKKSIQYKWKTKENYTAV